ncbi:sensor histidine kinase [Vallitalea okinawensis]|uniref:sensor histidine kinase n=1 Tax=Vallitalea okinawensis TaxID=2078660 RepID=UPI000CFE2588|nr:histidine kinase [Vallitalea okinawensis]
MKYNFFFHKPSILSQLIVIITLTILAPLIFLGLTTYNSYTQNMENTVISTNFDTLNQADQNISNILGDISSIINHYDNNMELEIFLNQNYDNKLEKLRVTQKFEDHMNIFLATTNQIYVDVILVGKNNEIYSTSTDPHNASVSNIYRTYWYETTSKNNHVINWFKFDRSYFTRNENRHMIVATKNLLNRTTQESYGIIIIEIYEKFFYDRYKEVVNEGEVFMIQDSQGNIITTSDRSVQLAYNSQYRTIKIESSNLIYNYLYKDEEYLYLGYNSSISDWRFIKLISTDKINRTISVLRLRFIMIFLGCAFFLAIGIIIIVIDINKPIKQLTKRIRNNFLHPVSHPSNYEDTSFINAFTSYEVLIAEVDETVNQLIRTHNDKLNAELYALKMQINPHFLYNTLNSIKSLVWTNKTEFIEPTITSLVKLLRQTLQNPRDYITLAEEIELLKHYIYIQNIRTDNCIQTEFHIGVDDLTLNVPSLILQPIVENAIFHGIEPLGKIGTINISSYRQKQDLIIEVFDNGIGIQEEKLGTLLLTMNKKSHHGLNGIGLANIHQRLLLNYGKGYGVQVNSKVNIGTSVTIRLRI